MSTKFNILLVVLGMVFLFGTNLFAQLNVNIFNEQAIGAKSSDSTFEKTPYLFNQGDFISNYAHKDSFMLGADFATGLKNNAISYYDSYKDSFHYLVAPYFGYSAKDNFSFFARLNLEKARTNTTYVNRPFWAREYAGLHATFDIAKIEYKTTHFKLTFGRDYFMPGVYFYENLLFSRYNTAYDQMRFSYENTYFRLMTYNLALRPVQEDGIVAKRNLTGHRISINLPAGYLAFNDLMIYGGENQLLDLMALNPFLLLYPYVANKKHLTANNIMSLEMYLKKSGYFVFLELVVDDFQVDHKAPGDLEPPEWGINMTLGKDSLFHKVDWKINYTRVANRTFNAPVLSHEKYIHNNYPIGHWLGNNFWELKTTFTYRPSPRWTTDVTLAYLETGDEALYGTFNMDYLQYTVEQGYVEKFPFGKVKTQAGLILKSYYNVSSDLLLRGSFSYWPKNTRLENDFNFAITLAYRIDWKGPE